MFVGKRSFMKKLIFPLIAIAFVFAGCNFSINFKEAYDKLPPEGKTFAVKPFKAIQADGVFSIILTQDTREYVTVKGDLPKAFKVSNVGDTLVIADTSVAHISGHSTKTDVYINFKDVNNISISAVGETTCGDTLKVKQLDYTTEGVGSTTLWVNVDTLTASNDGVGKLTIAGKAALGKIEDNGVGALFAKEFKADVLHADVNGVGAAKVYANKELYLNCSGVGGVEYSGPAKVVQSESSGVGKVEKED